MRVIATLCLSVSHVFFLFCFLISFLLSQLPVQTFDTHRKDTRGSFCTCCHQDFGYGVVTTDSGVLFKSTHNTSVREYVTTVTSLHMTSTCLFFLSVFILTNDQKKKVSHFWSSSVVHYKRRLFILCPFHAGLKKKWLRRCKVNPSEYRLHRL